MRGCRGPASVMKHALSPTTRRAGAAALDRGRCDANGAAATGRGGCGADGGAGEMAVARLRARRSHVDLAPMLFCARRTVARTTARAPVGRRRVVF